MSNQPVEGDFRIKGSVAEFFDRGKWKSCDLRSPYERGRADMLEQVIHWLNFDYQTDPNLSRDMKHRGGFDKIAIALEKAMRPQEEN